MRKVVLFCEDSFHEKFVGTLLRRHEKEYSVPVKVEIYSASGGLAKMHSEFKSFLRDLERDTRPVPDAVIVVADANCKGLTGRKELFKSALQHYPRFEQLVSYAIPDPHIERWMLVDSSAFQHVFGRGCTLPALKCEKDEYKKRLRNEIHACDIDAPLGGEEYAEDIVNRMDLSRAEISESSLGSFLQILKGLFNQWRAR